MVGAVIAKDLSFLVTTWSSDYGHWAVEKMGAYIKTYALPFFHSRQIYAEAQFSSIFPPFFLHFSHFSNFYISPFALNSSIFLPFFQAQICKL